jgi:ADP-heptose:LPS heptosyltransferase
MTQPTSRLQVLRRGVTQRTLRLLFRPAAPAAPADKLPRAGIHRILICRSVRTLGNSLLLTPLLHELAETWPGAEVDVVSRSPVAAQIYGSHFDVGHVIQLPRKPAAHPLATLRALRQLRRTQYDLVIDPELQSQSGRLLAKLAHARYSLGFGDPRKSGTLSHSVDPAAAPRHQALQPVFLLRSALGERPSARPYPQLELALPASARQSGEEALARILADQPPVVRGCIGIFTDATGDKRFDAAWWHRFIAAFTPGIGDYAVVEILSAASVRSQLAPRYPSFYSSDVRKLASVLANLAFFVSADCGVMHLGTAVGVPTVGLFKGTDTQEWGPYGDSNGAIDTRDLTAEDAAERTLAALRAAATVHAGSARIFHQTAGAQH